MKLKRDWPINCGEKFVCFLIDNFYYSIF